MSLQDCRVDLAFLLRGSEPNIDEALEILSLAIEQFNGDDVLTLKYIFNDVYTVVLKNFTDKGKKEC